MKNDSTGLTRRPLRIEALECRLLFAASVFDPNFSGGQADIHFATLGSTVQADGKIVVVGTTDFNANLGAFRVLGLTANSQVAVERFNPDGSPDPTFNNGQELVLNPAGTDELGNSISGPSQATAVTVDPQGRVLVAGFLINDSFYNATNGQGVYLVPFVRRLTADGQVDGTFNAPIGALHDINGQGAQLNTGNLTDYPYSIAVSAAGHVLVSGTSGFYATANGSVPLPNAFNLLFLRSYGPDGTPDASFGTGNENQAGLATYPAENVLNAFGVKAVYAPSEGAFYLTGTTIAPTDPFLLKFTDSGALFPGFTTNNTPFQTVGLDSFTYQPGVTQPTGGGDNSQAIAIQPDGKILVAGVAGPSVILSGDHLGIARFTPDGQLDPTFGTGGVVALPGNSVNVKGLEVQPDGQIDVAGTAVQNSQTAAFLAAFTPDGSLDTGFGVNGVFFDTGVTAVASGAAPASVKASRTGSAGGVLQPLSLSSIVQTVLLASGQVPDGTGILGEVLSSNQNATVLRRVRFDHTAPTAAIAPGPGVTSTGVAAYSFTVNYADNDKLDTTTLGAPSIMVTGPNGYSQPATLVSMSGSGKSVSATYQVTPPNGTWVVADDGAYTIALQPSRVTDAAGNAAAPVSAQFQVNAMMLTPEQQVQADEATLAADRQTELNALAADKSAAAVTAAADKALVSADKARVKADRHNPPLLAQDKAKLALDTRQSKNDAAAAKAKAKQDKASFAALVKQAKATLKADQHKLPRRH